MDSAGINHGTSGNVSIRISKGMIITPSSIPFQKVRSSELISLDFNGNPIDNQIKKSIPQFPLPSSEWKLHAEIFKQRHEVNAVLHCHSTNATALACHGRGIPSFHYMVAIAGGDDIKCAEYATFGSKELSNNAIKALKGRFACLLAHHGQVTISSSLKKALNLAIGIENLAEIYLKACILGEPPCLDKQEMELIKKKFNELKYGHQKKL